MKFKLILISLVLFAGISYSQAFKQEVFATAGEYYYDQDIELSWTIGESVISTIGAEENILTQGFHQSGIFLEAVRVDELELPRINVFPNPAENFVFIETGYSTEISVEIYDMHGRKLITDSFLSDKFIDVNGLSAGMYLLNFYNEEGDIITTKKIQKN